VSGSLLFPATLKIIEQKLGKPLSRPLKYFAVIASMLVGIGFTASNKVDKDNEQKKNEQLAFDKLPQSTKDSIYLAKAKQDSVNAASNQIETPSQRTSITVTSEIVKKVDGKFRYFFDIRNKGETAFEGTVKIWCITDDENFKFDDSFKTNKPIESGLGTSQYIELNTGTTSTHGANGISKYRYEVIVNSDVVQRGGGEITSEFENLDI